MARAPNPFASVCGRVCAAPCEDACRRGAIDAPVSIRALKRLVTEQYGAESVRPATQDELRPAGVRDGNRCIDQLPLGSQIHGAGPAPRRKVAIIGAWLSLAGSVIIWILVPLAVAIGRLRRADL